MKIRKCSLATACRSKTSIHRLVRFGVAEFISNADTAVTLVECEYFHHTAAMMPSIMLTGMTVAKTMT